MQAIFEKKLYISLCFFLSSKPTEQYPTYCVKNVPATHCDPLHIVFSHTETWYNRVVKEIYRNVPRETFRKEVITCQWNVKITKNC